jgi:ribonuclease P protein component
LCYIAAFAEMIEFKKYFSFSKKEIDAKFKHACLVKRVRGMTVLQSPIDDYSDFGKLLIITPRKSGCAVKRNLIRRRIKHIFYEGQFFNVSMVFIVLVYKEAMDLRFDELKNFLVSCFEA